MLSLSNKAIRVWFRYLPCTLVTDRKLTDDIKHPCSLNWDSIVQADLEINFLKSSQISLIFTCIGWQTTSSLSRLEMAVIMIPERRVRLIARARWFTILYLLPGEDQLTWCRNQRPEPDLTPASTAVRPDRSKCTKAFPGIASSQGWLGRFHNCCRALVN